MDEKSHNAFKKMIQEKDVGLVVYFYKDRAFHIYLFEENGEMHMYRRGLEDFPRPESRLAIDKSFMGYFRDNKKNVVCVEDGREEVDDYVLHDIFSVYSRFMKRKAAP